MRLDKFLKVSRIIKRRTVANEACDAGRVLINDKPAKARIALCFIVFLSISSLFISLSILLCKLLFIFSPFSL